MFPLRSARWLLGASLLWACPSLHVWGYPTEKASSSCTVTHRALRGSRSELFSTLPLKSLTSDTRTETLCYTSSMKPTHWEVKAHCAVFTAPHIHLRSFISTFSLVLTLIETQFKGPALWELSCKHRVICVFCFQLWEIDSAADQNHKQQHLHRGSIVSFLCTEPFYSPWGQMLFTRRTRGPRLSHHWPAAGHFVAPALLILFLLALRSRYIRHTLYTGFCRGALFIVCRKKKASLKQTSWWEEMLPEDRAAVPMARTTRKQNP